MICLNYETYIKQKKKRKIIYILLLKKRGLERMNEQEQSDNLRVMNLADLPDRYFVVNEQKPVNQSVANLFDFDMDNLPSFDRHHRYNRRLSSQRASDAFFSQPFYFADYASFEEANNENELNDDDYNLACALNRKQARSSKKRSITYKKLDSIKINSENNSGTNNASFIESRSSKNSPPHLNVCFLSLSLSLVLSSIYLEVRFSQFEIFNPY